MKRLAILGASGHGKVIADAALLSGWQDVVFYDDAWPQLKSNGRWNVIGNTDSLLKLLPLDVGVVVAIGNNSIRQLKQQKLNTAGAMLVTIIHPSAVVSQYSQLGIGTVVFANATINASSVIGDGVIINTGAVIEHDCVLSDFTHLSPNSVIAGGVRVGALAWLGACASVKQLISVGENAIVGMGAVVTKDVPPGVTVVGNPAKPLTKS